ncbi:Hypothetical protein EHI5A_166130 [Entamoeba histolytica KU27]|uniref:Uncharacterized protein n=1 Tax=Entamoeba histolytica KU27 TaxID=885311 RepID=M2SDU8_ENTHI|nr:Hypothetical protein EHI5A_166130 [Entamoeba histolytica KU27]
MVVLFLFIVSLYASSCQKPITIQENFDDVINLSYKGETNKWSCQQVDSEVHEDKSVIFQYTPSSNKMIEVSTCYAQTNFATRIIIGSSCIDDVTSSCVGANDGDPNGLCDGHRSKLIVNVKASQSYFIIVSGVTNHDSGSFRLTIKEYINPTSTTCSNALKINSFPQTVDATILSSLTYSGNYHGLLRGMWFKFNATQNTHVIDTCNKNTQYPTTIYLYKKVTTSNGCMGDAPIAEATEGCGSFARLYYDKLIVGEEYYVFVHFTGDTSKSPVSGSFEVTFRTNGGDNYKCTNSFSISKKPFNIIMDMSGYTKSTSPCSLNTQQTGMYFSVRGDGRRYAIHTCFTQSSGSDHTSLELYSNGCDNCAEVSSNTCGNDALINVFLEANQLYRFRVVCTNPQCKVNVGVMQIDFKDNYLCEHARLLNITTEGDQFTQYLIGSNQESYTVFDCKDNKKNLKGGWYELKAETEDMNIMHGVYTFKPEQYTGYLATLKGCSECIKSTFDLYATSVETIKKGESLFVFATTILREGSGNEFGTFMYWAVKRDTKGTTFDKAYEVTVPYSGIFGIGTQLPVQCSHLRFPNLHSFPAIILKYEQPEDTTYVVSTCGSETVTSTMIEVLFTQNNGNRECYNTNDINECGYGTTVTSSGKGSKYALVGINPDVSVEKTVTRVNIYENIAEESSKCSNAETITIPSTYYSYTEKAHSSRSKCGVVADGLKGKWFVYTPKETEKVLIQTDDVTTFNTQIGVYTSCEMLTDLSVPGDCYKGTNFYKSPVGQHGTILTTKLEKGQTYYIFVGGATYSDSGMMRVKFDYYEGELDNEEDGLSGGEIFGIIVAVLFLVVILLVIGLFVGYIGYKKYQNKHNKSSFGTF